MLSTENTPPDPSCPCEISQLKSSSSDEKACSDHQLASQELDLLNSGLDDNNDPLPKFSIRDYVFNARGKDIQTNWPFSEKNLQLCLKHGVKDLLPPFQPLDSVRNRSLRICAVETGCQNTNVCDGKPTRPIASNDAQGDQKSSVGCVATNLSGIERENEFPSITTSQSQSDFDSFPTNRNSCLGLEGKIEAAAVPPSKSRKAESTTQPPAKKCRLIVKLSNNPAAADPNPNEDNSSNNFVVSEAMASKVCPVCKTFSSSSNTTLNAHIDQCLSGESTIKWTASSRVIKHRIKPRKTRLMVDIYRTARHCTLEELDRRNGTNWATNKRFTAEENEVCAEEKEQRKSPVHLEGAGNDGAVYIDASGKKLRILSRFGDVPLVSKVADDPGPRKLLKGGKGNNTIVSMKKKKRHMQRHHKFQKLTTGSKRFCSTKPLQTSVIHGCHETNIALEGSRMREERAMRRFKAQARMKLNDAGTIRNWACSQRTGFTKKSRDKEDQCLRDSLPQKFQTESDHSSLGDSFVVRSSVAGTPNSSEYPDYSQRMGSMTSEILVEENKELPPLRKRVRFLSLGSQGGGIVKRSLVIPKQDVLQLRKGSSLVSDSGKDCRDINENHMYSPSKKRLETNAGIVKNSDSFIVSRPSGSYHAFLSKARKFSSLKNHLLSGNDGASVSESKCLLKRKSAILKKSQLLGASRVDKGPVLWPLKGTQQHDSMQIDSKIQSRKGETTHKISLGRSGVVKIKKTRGAINIPVDEEAKSVMGSPTAPHHHDAGKVIDSSVMVGDTDDLEAGEEELQTHGEENATETVCGINFGASFMGLSKSLDSQFYERTNHPGAKCDTQQFSQAYERPVCGDEALVRPIEPTMGNGQETLDVVVYNTHVGAELDSNNAQDNYFLEVDPIPIPGPPGSFLPSPGNMGSEDLQGNSSLTSSRLQSSEDHPDIDGDSSDSPISATSTISNSAVARSELSSDKLPLGPYTVEGENRLDLYGATGDSLVESSSAVAKSGNKEVERIKMDDMKVDTTFPEKMTSGSGYRTDQPCCCSRKEGGSQGLVLKESQLLRRRTMAAASVPASGKDISCDSNKRPSSLNLRSGFFIPSNHPSSGPVKVVLPATRSPVGNLATTISADSEVKIAIRRDCDSSSPSTHNPVLRLMGKNLMVVNNDEDASLQPKPAPSSVMNNLPNPQISKVSGSSSGNFRNEDYHSFHHMVSQGPITSGHNQCSAMGQSFDCSYLNNFRSHADSDTPQTPPPVAASMFANENAIGGFSASFEMNEYKGGCTLPVELNRARNTLNTTLAHATEKVATPRSSHCRNIDATSNPVKEVIIIDDSPETEADSASDPTLKAGLSQPQVSFGSPLASEYNPRLVNVFHGYLARGLAPYGGSSPGIQTSSFHMPPPRPRNACPVKWNYTLENASLLHSSSLAAPSSSTGHPRSTMYYSPTFS